MKATPELLIDSNIIFFIIMEPRTHYRLANMLKEESTSRTGRLNSSVHKQVLKQFYNEGAALII